jgi:hypothetical protein
LHVCDTKAAIFNKAFEELKVSMLVGHLVLVIEKGDAKFLKMKETNHQLFQSLHLFSATALTTTIKRKQR